MWLNVKLKTKRRNSITVIPLKLVSFRENLCFRNTSISIINYMHFSFVWSRLTLTTAILFPLESCPNNIFHIPAFIIGNINVTMGQTILILLIRYRWVASLQRFLTSRISFSVLPKWMKRIVSVKKRKKKEGVEEVISFWRFCLLDFNFYFKRFISKRWKIDPNAYRVSGKSREKFCYLKNIPFCISCTVYLLREICIKDRNSIP